MRVDLLGLPIDSLDLTEVLHRIDGFVVSRDPHQIVVANANKLWLSQRNPDLAELVSQADLVIPETVVARCSAFLGSPLKSAVCGIALAKALLPHCAAVGHRIFFLGARAAVLEKLVDQVRHSHPSLQIAGYHHGYISKADKSELIEQITRTKPDILLVGMGSPLQEFWIHDHCREIGVPVCVGVGGSFDVIAGMKRDAPQWVRTCGFEWLFRFIQDPKNLWKRYSITIPWLLSNVMAEKVRGRKPRIFADAG